METGGKPGSDVRTSHADEGVTFRTSVRRYINRYPRHWQHPAIYRRTNYRWGREGGRRHGWVVACRAQVWELSFNSGCSDA